MNSFKRREPDQKLKMQYKAEVRVSDNVSYYSYNFVGTSEPKSSLITAKLGTSYLRLFEQELVSARSLEARCAHLSSALPTSVL